MKVSVITVCYNAVSTLEGTILSVLGQTHPDLEYIVIDGGSTDGTLDIIRRYASRIDYWISEPDKGIFDAMNKGLCRATGLWVSFMNAGDRFYQNNVLAIVVSAITPQHAIVYGDTYYIRRRGGRVEKAMAPAFIGRNMPTSHQSFLIRTDLAQKIGFDSRYRYAADYNMVYNIYQQLGSGSVIQLPVVVSAYEAIEGVSMQHANEVFHETLRIRRPSLGRCYGYIRYSIKRLIGRK